MNGTIAQIVAITCHGNAYLLGQPGTQFFPSNSTCQFCDRVTFVTLNTGFFGRSKETEIAHNPDSWFDTIGTRGQHRHGYHQDIAPSGVLSLYAAILLDACQKAWVFGGMGSWNDLGFDGEDQKTYDRVSERLFQAVNAAIEQAATSTLQNGHTTGASVP